MLYGFIVRGVDKFEKDDVSLVLLEEEMDLADGAMDILEKDSSHK